MTSRPPRLSQCAIATAVIALLLLRFAHEARANPSVRLVVPYPSGGFTDRIARAMAEQLAPRLGTTVYVDIFPGAGGLRGSLEVARAAPDGTTLLIASPPNMAIAKTLSPNFPIDPIASFTPIAHIGGPPFVLVASHPRLPLAKLSDLAQAPPLATYGSPGFGTLGHILCLAISKGAGVQLLHVPYSKSMLPDLLGGHLDLGCISLSTVASLIAERRLFPLVIAGTDRRPGLPHVPALAEFGQQFPGNAWLAVIAPARMPAALVTKLNATIVAVLASPVLADMLKLELVEPLPLSSDELARLIQAETVRWRSIIARLELRP